MTEVTAQGLRSDIATAFGEYMAELVQAGPSWEAKPSGSADGEGAWSARQVAEHIAQAGGFFGMAIGKAAGAQGPAMSSPQFSDVAAAAAATPVSHLGLWEVSQHVQDSHLGAEIKNFGPLGDTNLGAVMGVVAYHYRDHANQLRALRG